jgi:hypothetical protein
MSATEARTRGRARVSQSGAAVRGVRTDAELGSRGDGHATSVVGSCTQLADSSVSRGQRG